MGVRFSAPVQPGPGAHSTSCTMGTGSFPGVKSGRGVTLTTHPLLVSWSRKGRAIPLLLLWVVRPVQSLSACTRVTFTFTHSDRACNETSKLRNDKCSCSFRIADGTVVKDSKVGPGCSSLMTPPESLIIALNWVVSGVNE